MNWCEAVRGAQAGKVLVAGGWNATGSTASAELYDFTSETWTPTGSMAEPRSDYPAALLTNGRVLVAGGGGSFASAETYDPSVGTWTSAGSMSWSRVQFTATSLANGKVLVAGGDGVGTAELYDPAGCPGITVAPSSLPGGSMGVPYSQTITASGGTPPYSFTVAAGAIPIGLTLSPAGSLSGTPSVAATFGFTVTATDARNCTGSQSYAVTISGSSGTSENIIVGRGLGQPNPNRVKVFKQDGTATSVDFLAYGAGQWGVNVAGGNATSGALEQIFTGPGPGAVYGPQVRGFLNTGSAMAKINFYAYGTLRYGVNATTGDIDQDGYDEILSGAGPGAVFGPHVRGWGYDNTAIVSLGKVNYFAYSTLKYGVNVASADVEADGYSEIVTGPGPGAAFGPQVRGWNYDDSTLTSIAKINFLAFTVTQYGVNVAGGDVEADSYDEIACALGPGTGTTFAPRFKGFNFDAASIAALPGFDVTVSTSTSYGGRVGLGDVTGDGQAELLAGQGRDPAADARVMPYLYRSASLTPLITFNAFAAGARYGVNVSSGNLGW